MPDIIFTGEDMPPMTEFFSKRDFKKLDLLLVIGSSLMNAPLNKLARVDKTDCHTFMVSDIVAEDVFGIQAPGYIHGVCKGDCEAVVVELASALGWKENLLELEHKFLIHHRFRSLVL
jgi:NAD-dependent SIR2 family protein deacetylase